MQEVALGAAKVTVINIGDLRFSLKDVIDVPESTWRPMYGGLFEEKLRFPTQSVLVSTSGTLVLVDVGEYSRFATEGGEYVERGYQPPPGLVEQLAAMNIGAGEVGHVVITHAHLDHYAGVTTMTEGRPVPVFPKARYHLGEADWKWPELRKALSDRSSTEARTLGRLDELGALELVSKEKTLAPGVSILPAPGESPGHQILRVRSGVDTAYCVGDLFHHRVEVENPDWMASWCDHAMNMSSRKSLIERAIQENAVVVPTHVPPGRIVRSESGATYVELAEEEAHAN